MEINESSGAEYEDFLEELSREIDHLDYEESDDPDEISDHARIMEEWSY